jgi:hypothetical protein
MLGSPDDDTPHPAVLAGRNLTVTLAMRALRQDLVGAELATPLREEEVSWLDADLG